MLCQGDSAVGTAAHRVPDQTPFRHSYLSGGYGRIDLQQYTKSCMIREMPDCKPVEFRGSALADLRRFPNSARREVGYLLDQVQQGLEPDDWKPIPIVGRGVREIRVRDATGAFRVLYLAIFADAVYVLHCFMKKSQKTSKSDLDLAERRYRDLAKELRP